MVITCNSRVKLGISSYADWPGGEPPVKGCSIKWLFAFFLLICKCSWYIQDKYWCTHTVFPLFTLTGVFWWRDGLNFNVIHLIIFPLWGKSTSHASLVKKSLPLQVMKTSSYLPLTVVRSHPPFCWVSCSIWKASVYGRRETEFSLLPLGHLVAPVHALEAHPLPMHCSVTSLINLAGLFALSLNYCVSVAGLGTSNTMSLDWASPLSPTRTLRAMAIFSTLYLLHFRACVTIPIKICLDSDWDYTESVISLKRNDIFITACLLIRKHSLRSQLFRLSLISLRNVLVLSTEVLNIFCWIYPKVLDAIVKGIV